MTEQSTVVDALNLSHREAMRESESVVVLGEDIGVNGGVFRVTEGLLEKFGDRRVMDTPLAEAGILGSALGMAVEGLRPVAEIQFSGFIHPGMDQIVSHISRFRNRSRGTYDCPLVIRAPYSGGIKAPEHHSESLEAMYCHIPGLKVMTFSNPVDARRAFHSALRSDDPFLLMEPKRIYRSVKHDLPEDYQLLEEPAARYLREGDDVTVVSWGAMSRTVHTALEQFELDVSVEHLDLLHLYPLDEETILDSVKRTGRLVVVQEAPLTASLAGEIASLACERAFLHLEAPVKRVSGYDTIIPLARLEDDYIPGGTRILDAVREVVEF